jgi:transcriptional regulator with XRE-family HTH domain
VPGRFPNLQKFHDNFGRAVRRRRLKLGVSQERFAELCGLHRTYISDIERGLKSVSLKTLLKISIALDVPPYQLVKDGEDSDT